MRRPVIGLCTALERAQWSVWDQPAALLPFNYITALQRAGALAIMVPPGRSLVENPGQVLDLIDGLVLAGGADIDPAAYGEPRHPETVDTVPERDASEIALTRAAIERDLPLLGICRGMQLINVACGGTLVQHLPDVVGHDEHRRVIGSFDGSDHEVTLKEGSLAAASAGEATHVSMSHHHQAVDRLGKGLVVSGTSDYDQFPEAIEMPGRLFVLGVQWHPEADESSRVLQALVDAASRSAAAPAGS